MITDDLYKSWSHLIIVPLLVHYYYLLLGDCDKYFPINHPHWHILNLPCGSWQWSSYRIHVPLKLKLNYRKKMQKSVFVKVIVAAASAPPEPQHKTHKPSARTRIVISLPSSDLWPAKSARCFWSCRHQCLRQSQVQIVTAYRRFIQYYSDDDWISRRHHRHTITSPCPVEFWVFCGKVQGNL